MTKKRPFCFASYEERETSGQRLPQACPECNLVFGAGPLSPDARDEYQARRAAAADAASGTDPLAPDWWGDDETRGAAAARELRVLEYCHAVLAERALSGAPHGWLWRLKDGIAVGAADYLRDNLPKDVVDSTPPLTEPEMEAARAEHPLLQLDRRWIREIPRPGPQLPDIRRKLYDFTESLKQRRRTSASR